MITVQANDIRDLRAKLGGILEPTYVIKRYVVMKKYKDSNPIYNSPFGFLASTSMFENRLAAEESRDILESQDPTNLYTYHVREIGIR